MIYKKIQLDKNNNSYLEVYAADKIGSFTRNAILVIPGGGYSAVCAEREGEPIAMAFIPHGYNAFVLHYSVNKAPFPTQLIEASKAIKHIRDNAQEYNIDPYKLFTVGFSAGAHLAASLGTMWDKKEIYNEIDMPFGYNKPTGMMLIYPVISSKYHSLSLKNLLQNPEPTDEEFANCNIENYISENSSPAFILHTSNDEIVDVRSSLLLADTLADKKIKFEMHIYPDAPHGAALGNKITECNNPKWCNPAIAKWVENAVYWANNVSDNNSDTVL